MDRIVAHETPHRGIISTPADLAQAEPMGFPNITDTDIDWNDGSKTFTLSKTGPSFQVWVKGLRYTFEADQVLIGDGTDFTISEGMWFFYFNAAGVLVASQTIWQFSEHAPVAIIYWDNTGSTAIVFADERHGLTMSWATHKYLHETEGASYKEGLGLIAALDQSGAADTDAQVAVADGEIQDEDLVIKIVDGAGGGRFEQELSPIAEIPVYYRVGVGGDWRKKTADTFPVYQGSLFAATRCGWNDPDAGGPGVWGITEIGDNRYTDMILCGTNDYHEPVIAILGQMDYNTIGDARDTNPLATMDLIGLPVEEIRYLYRLILQTKSSYTNTVKGRWRSPVTDIRALDIRLPASPVVLLDHQTLICRNAVGAHPGIAVGLDTTDFDGNLSGTDTDVQKAMDTLDDMAVGGALVDLSDVSIASPADNELLAYDDGTSKWINQTPAEAGLLGLAGGTMTGIIDLVATTATAGQITQAGTRVLHTYGTNNVFFGANAGNFTATGLGRNFGLGVQTLDALTTGYQNAALGAYALTVLTTGFDNLAIGYASMHDLTTGNENVGVGREALHKLTLGGRNVGIGERALYGLTGPALYSSNSVGIGRRAGYSNTFGGGVYIGATAGVYETAPNKLFIDNAGRTNEATARLEALIYGIFAATTADQNVTMNAVVNTPEHYEVAGTQVVGARGAAVADATGDGDVVAQLNALLARCRAHGLIAP